MMALVPGLALAGLAVLAALGSGLPFMGSGRIAFWVLAVLGFAVHGAICAGSQIHLPKAAIGAGVALGVFAIGVAVAVAFGCQPKGAVNVIAAVIGLKVAIFTGVALTAVAAR